MEGWNKFQSSLSGLNIGQSASKFAKGFNSSIQATKERLGQIPPEEITELPQGASNQARKVEFLVLSRVRRVQRPRSPR